MDSLNQQNYQIKIYFNKGLRDLLVNEYFFVVITVAIALFQNGQLPVYMPETKIQSIFESNDTSPCILKLREGLYVLYLDILMKEFSVLQHLLRPNFAPHDANVYGLFVKYVRQVSGT